MKKLFLAVLALMLLAGCSARKEDGYTERPSYNYDYYPEQSVSDGGSGNGAAYLIGESENSAAHKEEKLVYTSGITIESKEYDKLLQEVSELIDKYEGFRQTIDESDNERRVANLVIRIPSKNFDAFIEGLKAGSGNILNIKINVDNITQQYNDNEIRIQTLETQYQRLLELLKEAGDLSDVIELEDRISQVEYDLMRYNNNKNTMDAQVAYSTITMSLREVITYSTTKIPFFQRIKDAFAGSWEDFKEGFENFVIDLIYALPRLLIFAAVVFILWKPAKKWISSYKAKKEEKRQQKLLAKEQKENK